MITEGLPNPDNSNMKSNYTPLDSKFETAVETDDSINPPKFKAQKRKKCIRKVSRDP